MPSIRIRTTRHAVNKKHYTDMAAADWNAVTAQKKAEAGSKRSPRQKKKIARRRLSKRKHAKQPVKKGETKGDQSQGMRRLLKRHWKWFLFYYYSTIYIQTKVRITE